MRHSLDNFRHLLLIDYGNVDTGLFNQELLIDVP